MAGRVSGHINPNEAIFMQTQRNSGKKEKIREVEKKRKDRRGGGKIVRM